MTRTEALHALIDGKRIRHNSWTSTKHLVMIDGIIKDDYDRAVNINIWPVETGWELCQEPNPHTPGTFAWAREEARRGNRVTCSSSDYFYDNGVRGRSFEDNEFTADEACAMDWEVTP